MELPGIPRRLPMTPMGGGTPWHFYNEDRTFITGAAIAAGQQHHPPKGRSQYGDVLRH